MDDRRGLNLLTVVAHDVRIYYLRPHPTHESRISSHNISRSPTISGGPLRVRALARPQIVPTRRAAVEPGVLHGRVRLRDVVEAGAAAGRERQRQRLRSRRVGTARPDEVRRRHDLLGRGVPGLEPDV